MVHILSFSSAERKRFSLTFCGNRNKLNELRDNGVSQLSCVPAVSYIFCLTFVFAEEWEK